MKKKILLADDDPDQIFQVSHHLKKWGYDVVAVESREEAERYLQSECPDLAILDLMMEEVDAGTNFVKELKALGNTAPIYMVSSVGDHLALETSYSDLGLAGVFQKPIDPADHGVGGGAGLVREFLQQALAMLHPTRLTEQRIGQGDHDARPPPACYEQNP